MALEKEITFDNGMTLGYHRVASCYVTNGVQRILIVRSYQGASSRALEKEQEKQGLMPSVYYFEQVIPMDYDESIGLTGAYTWLKQTELFDGATDATDEDDEPIQPTEPVMTVSDLADAVADLSESVSDNSDELSDAIAELAQLVSDIDEKVSNL